MQQTLNLVIKFNTLHDLENLLFEKISMELEALNILDIYNSESIEL